MSASDAIVLGFILGSSGTILVGAAVMFVRVLSLGVEQEEARLRALGPIPPIPRCKHAAHRIPAPAPTPIRVNGAFVGVTVPTSPRPAAPRPPAPRTRPCCALGRPERTTPAC